MNFIRKQEKILQEKEIKKSCTREITKQKKHSVISKRVTVMTDSTEEGMTMFRWRCILLQWGIISGNTTN